jgi:peptidyl-prolyl cis-trans isomerase C
MKFRAGLLIGAIFAIFALAVSCSDDNESLAARVNGEDITIEEFETNLESMKAQFAAQGQSVPDEELASFKVNVLDNLIRTRIFLDYAEEHEYTLSDDEIDVEIQTIQSQFESKEAFLAVLEQQGFTEKTLRKEIEKGMTIERMLEAEVIAKIVISPDEVETFYNENQQYFARPESVSARHILVMASPEASDDDHEKALAKIKAIRQEIVDGADFAAVARQKSEGPSAPDGGFLGAFGRGQMVPPFEEVAFALEPGVLSDVVKTDFGYHLILVDETKPAGVQSVEEADADIREFLLQQREQTDVEKFAEDLKALAAVETFLEFTVATEE